MDHGLVLRGLRKTGKKGKLTVSEPDGHILPPENVQHPEEYQLRLVFTKVL